MTKYCAFCHTANKDNARRCCGCNGQFSGIRTPALKSLEVELDERQAPSPFGQPRQATPPAVARPPVPAAFAGPSASSAMTFARTAAGPVPRALARIHRRPVPLTRVSRRHLFRDAPGTSPGLPIPLALPPASVDAPDIELPESEPQTAPLDTGPAEKAQLAEQSTGSRWPVSLSLMLVPAAAVVLHVVMFASGDSQRVNALGSGTARTEGHPTRLQGPTVARRLLASVPSSLTRASEDSPTSAPTGRALGSHALPHEEYRASALRTSVADTISALSAAALAQPQVWRKPAIAAIPSGPTESPGQPMPSAGALAPAPPAPTSAAELPASRPVTGPSAPDTDGRQAERAQSSTSKPTAKAPAFERATSSSSTGTVRVTRSNRKAAASPTALSAQRSDGAHSLKAQGVVPAPLPGTPVTPTDANRAMSGAGRCDRYNPFGEVLCASASTGPRPLP